MTRFVVGIAGPPGAGKSTLAQAIRDWINAQSGAHAAEVAPMDGFHLDNATLRRLGKAATKGAADTFAVAEYVAALRRLRDDPAPTTWPAYDRTRHAPAADAVTFDAETGIVITEGNYLLLDAPGWAEVRPLLDLAYYLDADPADLADRLVRRHVAGGMELAAARRKVAESDLRNARLVAAHRDRADEIIQIQDLQSDS
ncbi:MAG: AAA family ATPase [Mycobacteriaceae bacterium]|nr:AAA family ATPase [Mycobacteriaceae bacterium]